MRIFLKCPYCNLEKDIVLYGNESQKEITMAKKCPCGKKMETPDEIRKKIFYTMIRQKNGIPVAVKKEGIVFEKYGFTLYAYQKDDTGDISICHVIEPTTGLSIQTVSRPLDVVYRYISKARVEDIKERIKLKDNYYITASKAFQTADRIETLPEGY